MSKYQEITDAEIAQGAPITQEVIGKLYHNLRAIQQGDATAPKPVLNSITQLPTPQAGNQTIFVQQSSFDFRAQSVANSMASFTAGVSGTYKILIRAFIAGNTQLASPRQEEAEATFGGSESIQNSFQWYFLKNEAIMPLGALSTPESEIFYWGLAGFSEYLRPVYNFSSTMTKYLGSKGFTNTIINIDLEKDDKLELLAGVSLAGNNNISKFFDGQSYVKSIFCGMYVGVEDSGLIATPFKSIDEISDMTAPNSDEAKPSNFNPFLSASTGNSFIDDTTQDNCKLERIEIC